MKYLRRLVVNCRIRPIVAQLDQYPELWNQHTLRTRYGDSPHAVDDIWVRYRAWKDWSVARKSRDMSQPNAQMAAIGDFTGQEHDSVWYPAIDALPVLKSVIFDLMRYFECERLGGVLITRIQPGGHVKPHIDRGWHATYYEKIAIQIKSAPGQAFCYADGEFECEPGTIYSFNNNEEHWVSNKSLVERITCIICVKRDQRLPRLYEGAEG